MNYIVERLDRHNDKKSIFDDSLKIVPNNNNKSDKIDGYVTDRKDRKNNGPTNKPIFS